MIYNPRQMRYFDYLRLGMQPKDAIVKAGVGSRSLTNWRKIPEFKEEEHTILHPQSSDQNKVEAIETMTITMDFRLLRVLVQKMDDGEPLTKEEMTLLNNIRNTYKVHKSKGAKKVTDLFESI